MTVRLEHILGRELDLLTADITKHSSTLSDQVVTSSFLVLGGAGTIGKAVVKELFERQPKKLHVIDINENNLVELVRDLRSNQGYISGEFDTFCLDIGSDEFDAYCNAQTGFDYVLNLSALKHVRSEKDPFTLMRMIRVNILNTIKSIELAKAMGAKKYFCVSTDKAANPANMMGASKRIMELFLAKYSNEISISTARFANVAFSDGSLLHSFNQRLSLNQPLAAPTDVQRYFVSEKEAGEICLLSCLLADNGQVFFPKLEEHKHLNTFSDIAIKFLEEKGFSPVVFKDEQQARDFNFTENPGKWPLLLTKSDTTGEKGIEEFFTDQEQVNLEKFNGLGIVKELVSEGFFDEDMLKLFLIEIQSYISLGRWTKLELVKLFQTLLPDFDHLETGKSLNNKM